MILPECVTEADTGTQASSLRRTPATHRTKHPEGHDTTLGSTTQRHACGGLQPHTAQSTPMGTTLYKAARHKAMLAAGSSHTPHKAPRWAQHYTKQHDTKPCLRRAPATRRTKHPDGHDTIQSSTTQNHACGGLQPHTAQSGPRGTTLHKVTHPARPQHHTKQPTRRHKQAVGCSNPTAQKLHHQHPHTTRGYAQPTMPPAKATQPRRRK